MVAALADFFINYGLLGGLALAAAPIIIHLLNKRRFKMHDWAAMDFLLEAMTTNRRRLRLEDLILLLLRILLITALVLALARPLVEGFAAWREDERVIVVDDSFSMGAAGAAGTVFQAARESAVSQVQDALGGALEVSLWFGSRPGEALKVEGRVRGGVVDTGETTGDEALDPGAAATRAGSLMLRELGQRQLTDASLQLAAVVDRVVSEAESEKEPRVRSVVLLSDFRQVDWLEGDNKLRDDLRVSLEEVRARGLANRLRFEFLNAGSPDAENVAVSEFRLESAHALAGVPVRLLVEVKNFGKELREHVDGELEVSGPDGVAFRSVERVPLPSFPPLPPGETASVEMLQTFERAGTYALRVRLDADRLSADNESHLVVDVRQGLQTVVVDGDPHANRFESESGYLLAALAPRGDVPSGILPRRVDGEVTEEVLDGADVVMVLNRSNLTPRERGLVQGFVENGGGLAFFLGNRVDVEAYSLLSKGPSWKEGGDPLLPLELHDRPTAAAGDRALLQLDASSHAVFEPFRGVDGSTLERVPFTGYKQLVPFEGAVVLARFDDDEKTPAMVEAPLGAGKVVVFNTTADRGWSDWPTDPSFPVLLQEWARYLAPRSGAQRQLQVGEPLRWKVTPGVRYEVITPAEERAPIDFPGGPPEVAVFDRTEIAGFYRLVARERAGAGETVTWFACRRILAESDLEPIADSQLESVLEPLGIEFSSGGEMDADSFRRRQEGEVWRWLALSAALVLLLELFAAWWFGRR